MTISPPSPGEVIGLANDQLEKAARWYKLSRRLPIATFTLSTISIFITNPYTYIPAALALLVQMCSWSFRDKAAKCHSNGEEGRTRGLLHDALGATGEHLELNKWLSRVAPPPGSPAPEPAPDDYFASASPHGLRRLCSHLQENAFWNSHQYQKTAAFYGRALVSFVGATVVSILIAMPLTSGDGSLIFARVLVAGLASGAALTQFSEWRSWKSAESKSERLDARLDALAECTEDDLRTNKLGTVLSLYGEYCVTTAGAPPVPKWIYESDKDRLNRLWEQRNTSS